MQKRQHFTVQVQQLQNTILFSIGLQFALRSGQEHRRLRPDMIRIIETAGSRSILRAAQKTMLEGCINDVCKTKVSRCLTIKNIPAGVWCVCTKST